MKVAETNKEVTPKRTEEIQHIIDRMPTKFGRWVTLLVIFIVLSTLTLGWVVKYHDIAIGVITINTDNAPVKLISNSAGKLKLYVQSGNAVKENEYLGYIYNSANVNNVIDLNKVLASFNINYDENIHQTKRVLFNKKYFLGELNMKYFEFLNALNMLVNYQIDDLYEKQELSLKRILTEYKKMIKAVLLKSKYNKKNADFFKKFFSRDSTLLSNQAISEAEFNQSELQYLNALSANETSDYEVAKLLQEIENTESKLQQITIEKNEKSIQLKLEVISTFSNLKDNIKAWEEMYVFKTPVTGKIQFLKFWADNHYIQTGEQVFTVIPVDDQIYGQVNLPNTGSGKVKIGQEVIIKLDDYPYMEYGDIRGTVKEISLTTHTEKTQDGEIENYLIHVKLPGKLITSYGKSLHNKHELRGTAEIITNNRRLIQRMFDNIKYLINN